MKANAATPRVPGRRETRGPQRDAATPGTFGRSFWLTYAANTSMMAAVSLLYRYADFVESLGGTEFLLGLIVGLGMVGSVLMRAWQGIGVDTYGARRVWLVSGALFIVSCLLHLTLSTARGPAIFLVRILWQTSVAGFFGASISYIAGRRSTNDMAQAIGTLGTSGFLGIVLGTSLGDALLNPPANPAPLVVEEVASEIARAEHLPEVAAALARHNSMILQAAAIAGVAWLLSYLATRSAVPPVLRRRPPLLWLLRRYHPGPVLLMGMATGFGLTLPPTFLRPYTEELGIERMGAFFYPYMLVAFVTRLSIRRLPSLIGITGMTILGLVNLILGIALFVPISAAWQLCFPALFLGIAHACMFPAVVAGGSSAFPHRYRGLGTAVMLAAFDFGALLGAPAFGGMFQLAQWCGWHAFTTSFVLSAALLTASGFVYLWLERRRRRRPDLRVQKREKPPVLIDPCAIEAV